MSAIGPAVEILVALSDLKMVKSIRSAVKANLIAAGGVEGALGQIDMPHGRIPRERESIAPRGYDAPRHPRVQQVAHAPQAPIVRTETLVATTQPVPAVDATAACPLEPRQRLEHGPLVPPWCMPLIPDRPCHPPVIKSPPPPPDVNSRGTRLDLFV